MAQLGSSMARHRASALSRHSVIHSGSFLCAEISRTVLSSNPFGANSDSISVKNPYLYS